MNAVARIGHPNDCRSFVIDATGIVKRFGQATVLRGIDLQVSAGEVVCIIGPSGSGKSTLLRCLNLLEQPDEGVVLIEGVPITDPEVDPARIRRRLGMVFQSFNLFSNMTVLQNVTVAQRTSLGRSKAEAERIAREHLKSVGIVGRDGAYPTQLSGGQQQRVGIARALAMSPTAILFDEPTSSLDPELVGEVIKVMKTLASEGKTMVVVTHEIQFAKEVADRVVFMDAGQIVEQGSPQQVIDSPRHERTRLFLSRIANHVREASNSE